MRSHTSRSDSFHPDTQQMTLEKFLEHGAVQRAWVIGPGYRAYLRRGQRVIPGFQHFAQTMELANVQAGDGTREHTGLLRPLFLALEAQTRRPVVFLENCSVRMADIAQRNGYTLLQPQLFHVPGSECYWKLANYARDE